MGRGIVKFSLLLSPFRNFLHNCSHIDTRLVNRTRSYLSGILLGSGFNNHLLSPAYFASDSNPF